MTLILSIIGGPGVGKTTTAHQIVPQLSMMGFSAEFVPEEAKVPTWEGHDFLVRHQVAMLGQQLRAYDRLTGKVDVIVADHSPLLYTGDIYDSGMSPMVQREWREFVCTDWNARFHLTVLLQRDDSLPYHQGGRNQTLEQARKIDAQIENHLEMCCESVLPMPILPSGRHVNLILGAIKNKLAPYKPSAASMHHSGILNKLMPEQSKAEPTCFICRATREFHGGYDHSFLEESS